MASKAREGYTPLYTHVTDEAYAYVAELAKVPGVSMSMAVNEILTEAKRRAWKVTGHAARVEEPS